MTDNSDCDDGDGDVNPDAVEVCDELDVDEDCSGAAEEAVPVVDTATLTLYYVDGDTDGYGDEDDPGTLYCDLPSASPRTTPTAMMPRMGSTPAPRCATTSMWTRTARVWRTMTTWSSTP